MHQAKPAKITSPIVTLKDDYVRLVPVALIVGAIGIAVGFLLSGGYARFAHAYLTAYMLSLIHI